MPTYNDVNIPFGSQVVTIGAAGFVAENISLEQPSQAIERRDEVGNPSGQVIVEQFNTGTAVLQLATTATAVPTIGATFTMALNGGLTAGVVVSQVGQPFAQLDARKVNISFRKRYAS